MQKEKGKYVIKSIYGTYWAGSRWTQALEAAESFRDLPRDLPRELPSPVSNSMIELEINDPYDHLAQGYYDEASDAWVAGPRKA